jgi:hypothetical protein
MGVSHKLTKEDNMAAKGKVQNDLQAHVTGYSSFTHLMKWGAIASFIVAMIVILIIRN